MCPDFQNSSCIKIKFKWGIYFIQEHQNLVISKFRKIINNNQKVAVDVEICIENNIDLSKIWQGNELGLA